MGDAQQRFEELVFYAGHGGESSVRQVQDCWFCQVKENCSVKLELLTLKF